MSDQKLKIGLRQVRYTNVQLSIHESAIEVYETWRNYGMEDYSRFDDKIFEDGPWANALQLSVLPVVEGDRHLRPRLYEAIGRFHTYTQIDALRPEHVTLAVLQPNDGKQWEDGCLQTLAQAMLVLEAFGRREPTEEFTFILAAAKPGRWPALASRKLSLAGLAEFLRCGLDALRLPRTSKEFKPLIRDTLDNV